MNIPMLALEGYYNEKGKRVETSDTNFSLTDMIRENKPWQGETLVDPKILLIMSRRIDELSARLGLPPMGDE